MRHRGPPLPRAVVGFRLFMIPDIGLWLVTLRHGSQRDIGWNVQFHIPRPGVLYRFPINVVHWEWGRDWRNKSLPFWVSDCSNTTRSCVNQECGFIFRIEINHDWGSRQRLLPLLESLLFCLQPLQLDVLSGELSEGLSHGCVIRDESRNVLYHS